MMHSKRKGNTLPVCWFLVSLTLAFLLIQVSQGQPQVYFKANAPAVKSLPRIGRRSDLETFPLLQAPNMMNLEGATWPEGFFYRDETQRKQHGQTQGDQNRAMGDEMSGPLTLFDLDQLAPNTPYFWRKFIRDPPQSSSDDGNVNAGNNGNTGNANNIIGSMNLQDDPPVPSRRTNIYRSRTRK